ncbi:MAG: Ppx/GppA phosphatase family protein [Hyphomicrobiaceae bacterium]
MAEAGSDDKSAGGADGRPPATRAGPAPRANGSWHADDRPRHRRGPAYGALDLGTNNCRLLIARPSRRGFVVLDAFSRIIRLGEGISTSGRLSDASIGRAIDALGVCAAKLARHEVQRMRLVATQACRAAENGRHFVERVERDLGLALEVLTPESEARLAVAGCVPLIDPDSDLAMVFDIGGGSSELIWLDLGRRRSPGQNARDEKLRRPIDRSAFDDCIVAWISLPVGVVTLAENHGGRHVTPAQFEDMVDAVTGLLVPFEAAHKFRHRMSGARAHFLGTSGTVTTVAGIKLALPRYDRSKVDGCWLDAEEVREVTYRLVACTYEERIAEPCIGRERADLVLAGCAILEALMRMWPIERLRVADRGLREGILARLMAEDGFHIGGVGRR